MPDFLSAYDGSAIEAFLDAAIPYQSYISFLAGLSGDTIAVQLAAKQSVSGMTAYAAKGSSNTFTEQNTFSKSCSFSGIKCVPLSKTASYVIDGDTDLIILADPTSGVMDVTLPNPANSNVIIIKDSGNICNTNNITVKRYDSEKIEFSAADFIMNINGMSLMLVSNGTDWFIV